MLLVVVVVLQSVANVVISVWCSIAIEHLQNMVAYSPVVKHMFLAIDGVQGTDNLHSHYCASQTQDLPVAGSFLLSVAMFCRRCCVLQMSLSSFLFPGEVACVSSVSKNFVRLECLEVCQMSMSVLRLQANKEYHTKSRFQLVVSAG